MTLLLVGLGLGSPEYLTAKALKALRSSDKIYVDSYTGFLSEELLGLLREELGGRVVLADRRLLEDFADSIVGEAAEARVCVASAGDPMVATTHVALAVSAAKRGVDVEVIHGVSIISAAASASGLQAYKFGRTVTIPKHASTEALDSLYRRIAENSELGLHTLVLLDTAEGGLSAGEAAAMLMEAEDRLRMGIARPEGLAVTIARLGLKRERKLAATLREIAEAPLPEPPHVLVLPSELHFSEREALISILGADPKLVSGHSPPRPSYARARRYIDKTARVVRELVRGEEGIDEAVELASAYVYDASSFLSSGRVEDSLIAVAYAEGILDCLRVLGKVSFEW